MKNLWGPIFIGGWAIVLGLLGGAMVTKLSTESTESTEKPQSASRGARLGSPGPNPDGLGLKCPDLDVFPDGLGPEAGTNREQTGHSLAKPGGRDYPIRSSGAYDGDTIYADVNLGLGVWLLDQRIRIAGIDAPELRGEEKEAGLKARDAVLAMLEEGNLHFYSVGDGRDKYGRLLGHVRFGPDHRSVGEVLLGADLAEVYE